jgi:hypothetical protein
MQRLSIKYERSSISYGAIGASSKVEKERFPIVGEGGKLDSRAILNGQERL